MSPKRRHCLRTAVGLAFLLLSPMPARALEAVVFLSHASPAVWATGIGGTLSSTWFRLVSFEAELGRQPGEPIDSSMTSFTASALLAPPVGPFTPYGGFGVGVF